MPVNQAVCPADGQFSTDLQALKTLTVQEDERWP